MNLERKIKFEVQNISKENLKQEFFKSLENASLKLALDKDIEEVVAFLLVSAVAIKEKYKLNENDILDLIQERLGSENENK